MPSIIIEQAVTNVDILVEPQITTFVVVLTEMQVPGTDGDNGWSPLLVADAITIPTKTLLKLSDWIGGEGDKPTLYIGQWQKADGTYTAIASEANDIKGADGVDGITQDISGKEDLSNKKIDVEANKTSDTFYPSIKSIVDWVTNLFVKGSGTQNYLPKFGVGGKVVGNSHIFDDGTNIGIGGVPYAKVGITGELGSTTQETLLSLNKSTTSDRSWKFLVGKNADTQWGSYGLRIFSGFSGDLVFGIGGGRLRIGTGSPATADSIADFTEKFTMLQDGSIGIGLLLPTEKMHVIGNGKFKGSVQVGDNTSVASSSYLGTTRYRATANNSYLETCMQVGASSYQWVVVKTNVW